MADDPKFSKQAENENPRSLEEFKKDPQSKVSDDFDRAKALQQQQKEQEPPQRQESEQVKKSAPGMDGPTPPGSVRGAVDRQAHNEKMAKDDRLARAKEIDESIKKDKENQPEHNREER